MSRMTSSDSFALAFDFLGALLLASPPPVEDGAEAFFFIALLFLPLSQHCVPIRRRSSAPNSP
jgi:hypothetical protein